MGMQGWNSGLMWICGLVLIVALVLTPRVGEARFRHAPEVDRPTIQEQVQAGGTVFPWHEREAYTQFMLERPIQSYLEHVPSAEPVFSDRGMPDTNAMTQKAQRSHTRPKKFCLRSVVR
jgi:predicted ATPase